MLFKKIINYYWVIGLLIYVVFSSAAFRSTDFAYLYITSFVTFLLYGGVITLSCYNKLSFYTKRNLALIVFIYSILVVGIFHTLSYIVDGDTFLFSKVDSMFYYKYTLQYSKLEMLSWLSKLQSLIAFDDWGAFFWMVNMFKIIPSTQFVSFTYCILSIISSLMLFDIGRSLMPRRYAFFSALTFSISSFTMAIHAVFLKETVMVFIIIASFNCFYNFLRNKNIWQLVFAFLFAIAVIFYRVPISLILLLSYVVTLILIFSKKPVVSVIIISLTALLALTFGKEYISYSYDRYLRGGDIGLIIERKNNLSNSGGFVNQMADPAAALLGPFPTVVSKNVSSNGLNTSGLILRLLITFPFLLGVYHAIKERNNRLYPLIIFFFINAIGVAISVKGLEIRLSYPHLWTVYIVAFWMLARFDYYKIRKQLSKQIFYASILAVIAVCIIWNLRGV